MSLEEYCQKNIFIPLGMTRTTYRPTTHKFPPTDTLFPENLIKMTSRLPDGSAVNTPSVYPISSPIDLGGANLYTTAPDFLALLQSLIQNDQKVLKLSTVKTMLESRLKDGEGGDGPGFDKFKKNEQETWLGENGEKVGADHCLAGMVNIANLEGSWREGSVTWGGATGCRWYVFFSFLSPIPSSLFSLLL